MHVVASLVRLGARRHLDEATQDVARRETTIRYMIDIKITVRVPPPLVNRDARKTVLPKTKKLVDLPSRGKAALIFACKWVLANRPRR